MKEKTCFFTGHRRIPAGSEQRIRQTLLSLLRMLIEKGYCHFVTGGAIGFDTIAAECVLELKKEYPVVRLIIMIPCQNQPDRWNTEQKDLYYRILSLADETYCLSPIYFDGCMQIRNRKMADMSSVCIAYLTSFSGGSAYTVRYAEKQGISVINIADKCR